MKNFYLNSSLTKNIESYAFLIYSTDSSFLISSLLLEGFSSIILFELYELIELENPNNELLFSKNKFCINESKFNDILLFNHDLFIIKESLNFISFFQCKFQNISSSKILLKFFHSQNEINFSKVNFL